MIAPGKRNGENGFVLVIVLWTIASMALLVSAFNSTVRGGTSVLISEVTTAKRWAAIEAGIEIAVSRLLVKDENQRWLMNGETHQITFDVYRLAISMQDANGLVDLNKADDELLLGLLSRFTASKSDAERVRDRILDWRDRDDEVRFQGAEDFNYERAGLTHGAGDRDFVDVTQLGDVLGVGPLLYANISPFLTVHGNDGRINPATAPSEVIQSVPGISGSDIDLMRHSFVGANEDTNAGSDDLPADNKWLTAKMSRAVLIQVSLLQDDGSPSLSVQAVIMPAADTQAPYRVLRWSVI